MLITISREYGAGGAEIGKRVADRLGWRMVDNEFVEQVASRAGLPPEEVAEREERPPGLLDQLARYAQLELPELFVPAPGPLLELEEDQLVRITQSLVNELATAGRCVLVGRAAAAVLAREADTLHVRIVAPVEFRIRQVLEKFGGSPAEAERNLHQIDRNRAAYHERYYDRDWNDPVNYDMVLNPDRLGFDGAADVIAAAAHAAGWI